MGEVAWAGWALAGAAWLLVIALWRAGRRRAVSVMRACHELRGPLGALRLGVELGTRRGGLSPARWHGMELEIGRAAQALDDLLGPGESAPPATEVDVTRLLSASVEAWQAAAGPRELTLDVTGLDGVTVWGRSARLAQATGNLIANAIEHGAGAIAVCARPGDPAPAPAADAEVVRIEVIDEGPGLPMPLAGLTRGRRGAPGWGRIPRRGHGLAITAAVAHAHGGRLLSAPSRHGARLVLVLPVMAGAGSRATDAV